MIPPATGPPAAHSPNACFALRSSEATDVIVHVERAPTLTTWRGGTDGIF